MNVINIHKRTIDQPKEKVIGLVETLSTKNDKIWPKGQWPAMRLDKGLQVGSIGGHGPIGYKVAKYEKGELIEFEFTRPKGFDGFHFFEITETEKDKTVLKHTIRMKTSVLGALKWIVAIRWLHDALIEDAFDKVENHFLEKKKRTKWNYWVKLLRSVLR